MLTINLALLLIGLVLLLLRRPNGARSKASEWTILTIFLVIGVLLAPTPTGQGILSVVGQLASGIAHAR